MAPHHALRHPRGAAGIDEEPVLRIARDLHRRAIAGDQIPERLGKGRHPARVAADLDIAAHMRRAVHHIGDAIAQPRIIDQHRRIAVGEDVRQLLRHIAVVDIDVSPPRLPARHQRDEIIGRIIGVEGEAVARLQPAVDQRARQIVRLDTQPVPVDHLLAMGQRHPVTRHCGFHRLDQVTEVEAHAACSVGGGATSAGFALPQYSSRNSRL